MECHRIRYQKHNYWGPWPLPHYLMAVPTITAPGYFYFFENSKGPVGQENGLPNQIYFLKLVL